MRVFLQPHTTADLGQNAQLWSHKKINKKKMKVSTSQIEFLNLFKKKRTVFNNCSIQCTVFAIVFTKLFFFNTKKRKEKPRWLVISSCSR